jgi:hypothetical protein
VSRPRASLAAVLASVLLTSAACGKKGPPLEPLRPIPDRVDDFSAERRGAMVRLSFVLPVRNQDNTRPADLDRVEIYGLTEAAEKMDRRRVPVVNDLRKYGALVATVEVRPPPPPAKETDEDQEEPPPPPPQDPADPRPAQGAQVTVVETLTEAASQPVVLPVHQEATTEKPVPPPSEPSRSLLPPIAVAAASRPPLIRSYFAIPVSTRNRDGVPSTRALVPLGVSVTAPAAPTLTNTKTEIEVSWTPPPGAPRRIQEAAEKGALRSRPIFGQGSLYNYNIYEASSEGGEAANATPLNQRPVDAPPYADSRVEFGTERCYVVRAVYSFGNLRMESDPSPPACITPVDTFPPAAPTGLAAVGSQGGISLIWEGSPDEDLAGYLVLRGNAGDETLQPLTPAPIRETTYRDTDVRSGVRYVYAVVAVDKTTPPNRSEESNRVEEGAR